MKALRPIDRWFIDEILPHEHAFLQAARRIERDPDIAGDLVREAYARLLALEGWASIANPRHYTAKMVRNLALERLRRAKVVRLQPLGDVDQLDVVDDSPSQHRVVAAQQLMQRIIHAVDQMPERCRAVLVRRRFDNQSASEAASELGISVSTLEKRLARSIVLLSQAVGPLFSELDGVSQFTELDENDAPRSVAERR
jgi:RNA polymerase sigma factor (sigma-70 family)